MDNSETETRTLEGWAKEEKFQLLQALNEYGCTDVDNIQSFLSYKTREEVETAINFYNRKALQNPAVISKRKKRRANSSIIPIANWAKLLTDTKSFEELNTEIALALRLIAEFEDKPPVVCTDKIDFKAAYSCLANALEGKPLPDNIFIKAIFEKCLYDIAVASKSFLKPQTLKKIISDINITDHGIKINSQVTNTTEFTTIKYLASQGQYNPLNIEEEYLKST
ncbi:uncharacterized protein LOC119831494 [Zerene cesonia]|uniref:uncharacterized protein LOC119831494 n=1 Tax=Zerene cesonia TaxID=33412 RepID=UPI0018E57020|nr:uncharacterized protein LOC119831494 [Zerene cesonia]